MKLTTWERHSSQIKTVETSSIKPWACIGNDVMNGQRSSVKGKGNVVEKLVYRLDCILCSAVQLVGRMARALIERPTTVHSNTCSNSGNI